MKLGYLAILATLALVGCSGGPSGHQYRTPIGVVDNWANDQPSPDGRHYGRLVFVAVGRDGIPQGEIPKFIVLPYLDDLARVEGDLRKCRKPAFGDSGVRCRLVLEAFKDPFAPQDWRGERWKVLEVVMDYEQGKR